MFGMNGWCKPDGDLISRAEAIDDLHGKDPSQIWDTADIEVWVNALSSAQPDTGYSDGYADGYKQGLKDAQPEQRWIPWNSGRFPKESGTYTVTAYDGATKRVTYAKYQKRLKRWELTGARAYWRVLAWMPLPEPYREDDHETD